MRIDYYKVQASLMKDHRRKSLYKEYIAINNSIHSLEPTENYKLNQFGNHSKIDEFYQINNNSKDILFLILYY